MMEFGPERFLAVRLGNPAPAKLDSPPWAVLIFAYELRRLAPLACRRNRAKQAVSVL